MKGSILHIFVTILIVLFLGATTLSSHCQIPSPSRDNNYGGLPNSEALREQSKLGGNPFETEGEQEQEGKEEAEKPKVRKPLESYFFDDSVRARPNFAWNLVEFHNELKLVDIDTSMVMFQQNYPFLRTTQGIGDAIQGNMGGASYALNYFDRARYQDFSFGQAYNTYYYLPHNVKFYNVKKPFTRFGFMSSGQKKIEENDLDIVHAQSISPSSGFHVAYKSRGTRGMFIRNKGRAKNLSIGFDHTGKNYTVHAGYIYNADLNQENGGLYDDTQLTDSIIDLATDLNVNLPAGARVRVKNNTYYVTQSYGFPLMGIADDEFSIAHKPAIFVGHSFEYDRWHKSYYDQAGTSQEDPTGAISKYYDNWFIHPTTTQDSIFESRVSNRVFTQIQPWNRDGAIGYIDLGVGMDNHFYYHLMPTDLISGQGSKGHKETSLYVYGGITGKVRKYLKWSGDFRLHPMGYRSGSVYVGGEIALSAYIKNRPITLSGRASLDRRSPDYWSQSLYSNHFMWLNSFGEETETRFDIKLEIPSINLEISASQSILSNKIYYAANKAPTQTSAEVSVSGVFLRKDFSFGGFHLNHRVLMQWSSSQKVVPVPLISAFASYYFEFNIVKNVLRAQFGVDARYNTEYYAMGWNPATSSFYNQRSVQVGGYPMLDVFFNAKWKRMRILLKMQHVNEGLMSRNYFSVAHHPQNMRMLKIGFSWAFYD